MYYYLSIFWYFFLYTKDVFIAMIHTVLAHAISHLHYCCANRGRKQTSYSTIVWPIKYHTVFLNVSVWEGSHPPCHFTRHPFLCQLYCLMTIRVMTMNETMSFVNAFSISAATSSIRGGWRKDRNNHWSAWPALMYLKWVAWVLELLGYGYIAGTSPCDELAFDADLPW